MKGYPDYRYLALPLAENDGGTGVDLWAGARVYNSVSESIPSGGPVLLTFDSERWDHVGLHDPASNPGRLTAQKAGKYLITAHVEFAINATGRRGVILVLNAATQIAYLNMAALSGFPTELSISTVYHLAVGDYVTVWVEQDSGGALNVVNDPNWSPEFAMQWVGP